MASLMDEYPMPGMQMDPRELEKAKYLALMRMGLGMASREPIGRAAGAGIATYSTMEENARRNADQKMQELKAKMAYAQSEDKRARAKAFMSSITPDQRRKFGIDDSVWAAIQAEDDPGKAYLARKETDPFTLDNTRFAGGGPVAQVPKDGIMNYFGNDGSVIGQYPVPGSIVSRAAQAGATAQAQEGAKAQYNFIDVPVGNQTVKVRSDVLSMLGASGLPPAEQMKLLQIPADQLPGAIKARQANLGLIANPAVGGFSGNGQLDNPQGGVGGPFPFGEPQRAGGGSFGMTADPISRKVTEEFNTKILGQVDSSLATAKTAAETSIPLIHDGLRSLQSGKILTGAGANVSLEFGRWLSQAGYKGAEDSVANTQAFVNTQKRFVLTTIKALGSGTGISDQDRKYAAEIEGADISLDRKSLEKLLGVSERVNRALIDSHNSKVDKASTILAKPELSDFYKVSVPDPYKPSQSSSSASADPNVVVTPAGPMRFPSPAAANAYRKQHNLP